MGYLHMTAAGWRGCRSWGAAIRAGEEFAGDSPLCMATTLVAAVRGDRLNRRCDGQPGPLDSIGPVNGLGLG